MSLFSSLIHLIVWTWSSVLNGRNPTHLQTKVVSWMKSQVTAFASVGNWSMSQFNHKKSLYGHIQLIPPRVLLVLLLYSVYWVFSVWSMLAIQEGSRLAPVVLCWLPKAPEATESSYVLLEAHGYSNRLFKLTFALIRYQWLL